MAIWCGFRGFYIGAAFCPSVFELSPFDFGLRPFLAGAFSLGEVVGGDFEANFLLWCSSFGEVDFVDLETRFCFFFL